MADLVAISCVVFFVFILYHETRRHQRNISVQQNPQDEVGRFTKEEKSIKTTVFIVGFVFFCLLTLGFFLVVLITGLSNICPINEVLTQAFAMLNRFLIN